MRATVFTFLCLCALPGVAEALTLRDAPKADPVSGLRHDEAQDLFTRTLGASFLETASDSRAGGQPGTAPRSHASVHRKRKALVVYAWYEVPAQTDNLRFFLDHVVKADGSQDIDFLFIDTTKGHSKLIEDIPDGPNIYKVYRNNVGFDMCSWKTGLGRVSPGDYTYFVLINGSVRGPFGKRGFLQPFVELLRGRVHLVGTAANCYEKWGREVSRKREFGTGQFAPDALRTGTGQFAPDVWDGRHLQSMFLLSMFLVTDSEGVQVLNETLSCDVTSKKDAVEGEHGELAMSQRMLAKGFGLAALQPYWRGHDLLWPLSEATKNRCDQFLKVAGYSEEGDPYYPNGDVNPKTMQPTSIDPEDVVMFKTNREVSKKRLEELTAAAAQNSSIQEMTVTVLRRATVHARGPKVKEHASIKLTMAM